MMIRTKNQYTESEFIARTEDDKCGKRIRAEPAVACTLRYALAGDLLPQLPALLLFSRGQAAGYLSACLHLGISIAFVGERAWAEALGLL